MIILVLLFASFLGTKVNVMLPLTTVSSSGELNTSVSAYFPILKNIGVNGVMVDVWWGITEPSPRSYNFSAYTQLADLCNQSGLKLQCVMSFHQCGGNVGDDCDIPIPNWVTNYNDIYYRDLEGHDDTEYVSLDVDNERVLGTRTPRQAYKDFMEAFSDAMGDRMGTIVDEVQVGLGPSGELRYPSYQSNYWTYPGVGEFQCYSDRMVSMFANASAKYGRTDWTYPPTDAGNYNSTPSDTTFFTNGYKMEYGNFFMDWYSSLLINHAKPILSDAVSIFNSTGAGVAMKVAGIHWWYDDDSHAAELTTGYINGNAFSSDAFYTRAAEMCADLGVTLDFTCFEMSNSEQSSSAKSDPETLVYQVLMATTHAGASMSAENALSRYDDTAYNRIIYNACSRGGKVDAFTYLRLSETLFSGDNFSRFRSLVSSLANC